MDWAPLARRPRVGSAWCMQQSTAMEFCSDPAEWAEQTFGASQLGDVRRRESLVAFAARAAAFPSGSISEMYGDDAAGAERAYHFLENERVDPRAMEASAFAETARRCGPQSEVILAIQDQTSLSYAHAVAAELGNLGSGQGILVHSTLAVRAHDRRILGLLDQTRWLRRKKGAGPRPKKRRAYRDKESFAWQAACERIEERLGRSENVITVCDRGADVCEFLEFLQTSGRRFVVRACHERNLALPTGAKLWAHMAAQPVCGTYTLTLAQRGPQRGSVLHPARAGRAQQTRRIELRAAQVAVCVPKEPQRSLLVNVIFASEPAPPAGETPIEWMLLTSEPIATRQEAHTVTGYYECRWLIEQFHKVWKSGCRIEASRLQHVDHLERLAVITAQIAARMLALRFLATSEPERPCTEILSQEEWQCLHACSTHAPTPVPASAPSVHWALLAIAKLGGWHDTKRTGIPGWQSLWRGWFRFQERLAGWLLARARGPT